MEVFLTMASSITIATPGSGGGFLWSSNPYLIIVSTVTIDKVLVYNRQGCCQNRIMGATITATVDGKSISTKFPSSPDAVFTFMFQFNASLTVTTAPSAAPTITCVNIM